VTIADEPTALSPEERAVDLVLARVHLRLGSIGLARAELETLAGRNALDEEGIRDLAEVRWRTGDLPGAGEAAAAYLEGHPDDVVALVIGAEIQSGLGRPGEARRLAGRALTQVDGPIDAVFAGMPRSSIWPIDAGTSAEPAGVLFADLEAPPGSGSPFAEPVALDRGVVTEDGAHPGPEGPGLWDRHGGTEAAGLPNPAELITRAKDALAAERPGQAAAALALALRAEPGLAPAVLDLIRGRSGPVLALVRGDAHRIVGHEAEAMRDYAAAVAAIGLERSSDDPPAEDADRKEDS
jgi:hypothetical protein